jgi:hypothetical protein
VRRSVSPSLITETPAGEDAILTTRRRRRRREEEKRRKTKGKLSLFFLLSLFNAQSYQLRNRCRERERER